MKKFLQVFLLMILIIILPTITTAEEKNESLHKSIVKIITYYEDSDYELTPVQTGTGIIIRDDGIILTNHHVIAIYGDDKITEDEDGIQVCLTESAVEEPKCHYLAEIIEINKEKDIVLLKLKNIEGLTDFPALQSLSMAGIKNYKEGDEVKALGYPGVGSDTITISSGSIVGSVEKYSNSWIKTDTFFSFGSSGGALIDKDNQLLGITTQAHFDLIGSLGYVVDINSINGWIDENINKGTKKFKPETQSRLKNLIIKNTELESVNVFTNDNPKITITKNNDWSFDGSIENLISVYNPQSAKGGEVIVNWSDQFVDTEKYINAYIEEYELINDLIVNISDTTFNGRQAKKIIQTIFGEQIYQILIPVNTHLAIITYQYGENDIDKNTVSDILDNIQIEGAQSLDKAAVINEYKDRGTNLIIKASDDWILIKNNSGNEPIEGVNTTNPFVEFVLHSRKFNDYEIGMNNTEYLEHITEKEMVKEGIEKLTDLTADRYYASSNYKINNELDNEIFYKYRFKDKDKNIKYFSAVYRIIYHDAISIIEFDFLGDDEAEFERQLNQFKEVLINNLTFGYMSAHRKNASIKRNSSLDAYYYNAEYKIFPSGECFKGNITVDFPPNKVSGEYPYKFNLIEDGNYQFIISHSLSMGNLSNSLRILIDKKEVFKKEISRPDAQTKPERYCGNEEIINIGELRKGDHIFEVDILDDRYYALNYFRIVKIGLSQNNNSKTVNKELYKRLKGKILLKVEDAGKAYYINPKNETMHYLGRPDDAFSVMREQGIGITNNNLYKIPVGIANDGSQDSDSDGLPDYIEDALGLNKNISDTDRDGYLDGAELKNGYNPWGKGKQNINNEFAKAQAGKIFLQVEKNGEAWYINPNDGKRYFLGRPADAFQVMRNLGLGISNNDFDKL